MIARCARKSSKTPQSHAAPTYCSVGDSVFVRLSDMAIGVSSCTIVLLPLSPDHLATPPPTGRQGGSTSSRMQSASSWRPRGPLPLPIAAYFASDLATSSLEEVSQPGWLTRHTSHHPACNPSPFIIRHPRTHRVFRPHHTRRNQGHAARRSKFPGARSLEG